MSRDDRIEEILRLREELKRKEEAARWLRVADKTAPAEEYTLVYTNGDKGLLDHDGVRYVRLEVTVAWTEADDDNPAGWFYTTDAWGYTLTKAGEVSERPGSYSKRYLSNDIAEAIFAEMGHPLTAPEVGK